MHMQVVLVRLAVVVDLAKAFLRPFNIGMTILAAHPVNVIEQVVMMVMHLPV